MEITDILNSYENKIINEVIREYNQDEVIIIEDGLRAPVDFVKKIILYVDQFIRDAVSLIQNKKNSVEVESYINCWNRYKNDPSLGQIVKKYKVAVELYDSSKPLLAPVDMINDYSYQFTRNMNAVLKAKKNKPQIEKLHESYLKEIDSTSDKKRIVYVTVDELLDQCAQCEKELELQKREIVKSMTSVQKTLDQIKDKDLGDTYIAGLLKLITGKIKLCARKTVYTYNTTVHEIKSVFSLGLVELSDKEEELARKWAFGELSLDERWDILEQSKYVRSIKMAGTDIKVYKLPLKVAGCANINGDKIVAGESFFTTYPPSIQNAIILHEIGHYVSGHYSTIKVPDEKARLKQIEKDYKKYCKLVNSNTFAGCANSDEHFIYLLPELEADRYAATQIGKRAMNNSLMYSAKHQLRNLIPDDRTNPTDNEYKVIDYNLGNIAVRNKLT